VRYLKLIRKMKRVFIQPVLTLSILTMTLVSAGCSASGDVTEFLKPKRAPSDRTIYSIYQDTQLDYSTSSDVLTRMQHLKTLTNNPADPNAAKLGTHILSQSKNVIALQGTSGRDHKMWLNMSAFDENSTTVRRKYFVVEDERPKFLFVKPWEGLRFETEMFIPQTVLAEPYGDDNSKRIAILNSILESFRNDIDELEQDNKNLRTLAMMVNQALQTALTKLDNSPGEAAILDDTEGLEFDHINLDKARIQMLLENDIATVKILAGSFEEKISFKELK